MRERALVLGLVLVALVCIIGGVMSWSYVEDFNAYPVVTYDEFNATFGAELRELPPELQAIGIEPSGRVVVVNALPSNDVHTHKLPTFVAYWMAEIHPHLPSKRDPYYFVLCSMDGYREHLPLYAGTLPTSTPAEKTDATWPVYHRNKTVFAFSKKLDDAYTVCIPDTFYIKDRGYTDTYFEEVDRDDIPWSDKQTGCVWRGTLQNGSRYNFVDWQNHTQNQREEFLARAATGEFPRVNAGTDHLSLKQQLAYKYVLDIDGCVSTWNATAWKMYSGSVMLKVGSVWKQWYYDDGFAPWVHYVPVQNDLSDLNAQLQWCMDHDDECQQISRRAREFVQTKLAWEYVKQATVSAVSPHL
jgi:hypothetical protein